MQNLVKTGVGCLDREAAAVPYNLGRFRLLLGRPVGRRRRARSCGNRCRSSVGGRRSSMAMRKGAAALCRRFLFLLRRWCRLMLRGRGSFSACLRNRLPGHSRLRCQHRTTQQRRRRQLRPEPGKRFSGARRVKAPGPGPNWQKSLHPNRLSNRNRFQWRAIEAESRPAGSRPSLY